MLFILKNPYALISVCLQASRTKLLFSTMSIQQETAVYILHSGRQCYTACQLWHVSSALLCVWMWPSSFLTIHLLHRANFTFTYFANPSKQIAFTFAMHRRILTSTPPAFVFDSSPLSTPRSCCVSSSFWRSTWKVPAPAAGSRPQHVQACCPSWWTRCPPGRSQMCWWCRWASLTTVSSRATTIASSW